MQLASGAVEGAAPPAPELGALLDEQAPEPLSPPPLPVVPPVPDPPLVPVPQMPFVQAPLAHSPAEPQLFPSDRPEPGLQTAFAQAKLAHWSLVVHALPGGVPWPLPEQTLPWHTPLAQADALEQLDPPGCPLWQTPPRQSPLEHSAFAVQALPPVFEPGSASPVWGELEQPTRSAPNQKR